MTLSAITICAYVVDLYHGILSLGGICVTHKYILPIPVFYNRIHRSNKKGVNQITINFLHWLQKNKVTLFTHIINNSFFLNMGRERMFQYIFLPTPDRQFNTHNKAVTMWMKVNESILLLQILRILKAWQ